VWLTAFAAAALTKRKEKWYPLETSPCFGAVNVFPRKIDAMKFLPHLVASAAMHLLLVAPAGAQPLPETKVVLRISREFILELTGKQFKREQRIDKNALGAAVEGSAQVDGTFDVKLQKSDVAGDFDLMVNGEVLTQVVATSRPVRVYAHGAATFSGSRRVAFDGNAFTGQAIEINVAYHSNIDQICSVRGGLIGTLARNIASPTVRRNLPAADAQAGDEIRAQMTAAIEKETAQLLATMNKVGPLLKQGEKLLREEKVLSAASVQHYLAATEQHLYMSIGPPGERIPTLPALDVSKRGPIELWIAIKKANKEDFLNPVLEHWNLIKPFVLQRIARRSPELVKIIEHVQVESVEGWYVVTFAPKLLALQ
jgi:hypothetical protein